MVSKKYPWNKWFKRTKFKLVKGTHYQILSHSMAQQVRNAAYRQGLTVKTEISQEGRGRVHKKEIIHVTQLSKQKRKKKV